MGKDIDVTTEVSALDKVDEKASTASTATNDVVSSDDEKTALNKKDAKSTKSDKVKTLKDVGFTWDKTKPRDEYIFSYFGLLEPLLNRSLKSEIDKPLAYCLINVTTVLWPFAIFCLFFAPDSWFPWVGLVYCAILVVVFMERYILAMHYSCHVKIFKPEYKIANNFANVFLAPLFGIPPGMYYLHHVVMHHSENNTGLDVSETESYDRSKFTSFLRYWMKFMSLSYLMPRYCVKANKMEWFLYMLIPSGIFMVLVAGGISGYLSKGVFWVVSVPHCIAIFAMAWGNFAQHIFVSPDNPDSNAELTYNCIETWVNQRTFNDGYHILHHQYARCHWADLPDKFIEELPALKRNKAFTFHNIHFFDVGFYVLTGQLEKLARNHYVHLNGFGLPEESESEVPTVAEIVEEMKRRLQPIPEYTRDKLKQW